MFGQKSSVLGSQKANVSNNTFDPKSFGVASSNPNPTFGKTSVIGQTSVSGASSSPAFGTSSSTLPNYGRITSEIFGQIQKHGIRHFGTFGASNAPPTSSFGRTTNTTAFGAKSSTANTTAFGASSSNFSFRSSPSFGQPAASPFGAQSFHSIFGPSKFERSRVVPYAPTTEWDPISHVPIMLQSISAMQAYKHRSHEELRWEEYHRGDNTRAAREAGLSSADLENDRQSALRRKEKLERDQRINEGMVKEINEKNSREALAKKEQAQKNRLAESLDAEIERWASGKEGNLRELLLTLQYILGSDSGWKPISLTDRTTNVEVRKAYRQATLHVHPDKLQQRGASFRQKYISEKVFHLLQVAWSKFNR